MKKIMAVLIVMIALIFSMKVSNTYTREARVDKIENNVVTFIDATGNLWEAYDEGYEIGQEVKLIMSNFNTDDITDDVIIKIK